MSTILLTGRNGFVGQAVAAELKKKHKVISVIRSKRSDVDYSLEEIILSDLKTLKAQELTKYSADIIIHLAASLRGKPSAIAENNTETTRVICDIAQASKIPVIYLSSVNALFQNDLGAYARSKMAGEKLLGEARVNFLIIRVPLIIGEKSPTVLTVRNFYKRFYFFPLFGPGQGRIQPIHISSLVDLIVAKANEGIRAQEVINVVGEAAYAYRQIMEGMLKPFGQPRLMVVPLPLLKPVAWILDVVHAPFFVSLEELKSINMDKLIEGDRWGKIKHVPNDKQFLFG